ncbi:MAG TPA: mechanosensitive ion channel family protein [Actinomycetota bacterium]|nr:mechanosensitive ion channel family protein [Actinomycetota bacterium]
MEEPTQAAAEAAGWFAAHGVKVLAIVGVAVVVTVVARLLVRRFRRKLEGMTSATQELNLQRVATLTSALSAAAVVVIWTIALLMVLNEVTNIAPLLASAGVAGVALGFGAQSLVRDGLSGFFILLENQFGVGDAVEIQSTAGPVAGKVESLTLRVTVLRAFDGTLHVVPNGNIQVVSNRSRGWARAIVDVRIAYGEDVERVRQILEELFEEVRRDPLLREWIMDGPSILGIEAMADYALVIRVVAETRPSKRWDAERSLRERIARRLDQRGVRVPLPPAVVPRPGEPGTP